MTLDDMHDLEECGIGAFWVRRINSSLASDSFKTPEDASHPFPGLSALDISGFKPLKLMDKLAEDEAPLQGAQIAVLYTYLAVVNVVVVVKFHYIRIR